MKEPIKGMLRFPSAAEVNLYDILEVENHPSLLEFKCAETGLLVWPLARFRFLRNILYDLMFDSPFVNNWLHGNYSDALLPIAKSIKHNIKHRHQAQCKILIMSSGSGHVLKGGRWFDRLTEYFASAAREDTLTVERLFKWRWPFPRHNEHVVFETPIQIRGALSGRLLVRNRHKRFAADLVHLARSRAKKYLNWELGDERTAVLTSVLARQIAAIPFRQRAYHRMLTQTDAKVVIRDQGCYGFSGVLNATAREMGLVVAEYQHGAVTASHDAYNVAPTLAQSSAYRKMLPQFFLGYGQWWNDQINIPLTKIAIGNPHRTEQLKLFSNRQASKSDILILGDGIQSEKYLDLAINIAAVIGHDFQVVFRPHPLESKKILAASSKNFIEDVRIDRDRDIYESFCTAHAVVSEVSTGLFEAVGLADRIFLWNTPRARFAYPAHPFTPFSNVGELVEKIHNRDTRFLNIQNANQIWAPNWRENYMRFLRENCGVAC